MHSSHACGALQREDDVVRNQPCLDLVATCSSRLRTYGDSRLLRLCLSDTILLQASSRADCRFPTYNISRSRKITQFLFNLLLAVGMSLWSYSLYVKEEKSV